MNQLTKTNYVVYVTYVNGQVVCNTNQNGIPGS